MADNFDLMATALKAVCPNNEILLDNAGKPSIMVRIPKMTYAQLGMGESTALFPAFIINGQEVDEIYMSQSSALHIWSSCSRLTRSVISWYRSLIVEALIPVSRTRSACVHFLSPRRVDSKILIIEPISFTSYSIKSSRVCKEYGRIWRGNGIF